MADIFDQIHTVRQGDIFDLIHKNVPKQKSVFEQLRERRGILEQEVEAGTRLGKKQRLESAISRSVGEATGKIPLPEDVRRRRHGEFTPERVEEMASWPEDYRRGALEDVVRRIYRTPGPQDQREQKVREALKVFVDSEARAIQRHVQTDADRLRWQEEADKLRGRFLAKTYRRWERGSAMVVGGGLHLAEELGRVATLGARGDTLAEWADMYHDVLETPEMQPVVENSIDKYLGGGVEMGPFLATTLLPGGAAKSLGSLPRIAGAIRALQPAASFLTAYGIESNLTYQGLKNRGYDEADARLRGVVTGLINAGVEVAGGSGGKYYKRNAVRAATTKLGRFRYFSRKALRTALAEGLAEEVPQEVVSMVLGGDVPKLEDGSVDWGKVVDRLIDTAIMGITIGGLISTPMVAAEAISLPSFAGQEAVAVNPEAMAVPGRTYVEASFRTQSEISGNNPWIKQDRTKSNKGRTLLVQFASDVLTIDEDPDAKAYYDKLYSRRKGYARLGDTWEIPKWITEAANFVPGADVYFVRDMGEARQFLKSSGYEKIMFSALDVNAGNIRDLASNYGGRVVVGGYVGGADAFKGLDNVTWYDSMEDMAGGEGYEYKPGVNVSHFEGSPVIPRLCMSKGCKHKCAFCVVPKDLEITDQELVEQQVDAMGTLDARLVYLDDKTFGQAENHKTLPDLYWRIKKQNPEFDGFIVQTTASQFARFSDEFLASSHIRYVELGVETFNDPILRELHKPASEAVIQRAMDRARKMHINVIPNIIIGLPQETAASYARTLEFLENNADVISHVNAYNLALYDNTELKELVGAGEDARDINENSVEKSFHKDPATHLEFAKAVYDFGKRMLDTDTIHNTGLTVDQEIAKQYGVSPGRVDVIFRQAEERYRELKRKETAKRSASEKRELAFLSRSRNDIETILEDLTSDDPVLSIDLDKVVNKTRTVDELTERGHGIAQQLGMTEEERRMVMAELTGKNSMGDMSADEMEEYVQYLESILEESGQTYSPQPAAYYEMLDQLRTLKRSERIEGGMTVRKFLRDTRESLTKLGLEFARFDRFFEWLDNGETDGWFKRTFYRPMVAANTARNDGINRDILDMEQRIRDLELDPAEMVSDKSKVNDHLELTGFERIGVYTLALNEHTSQYLLGMGLTAQDVSDVANFMDDKEKALAESFLEYYEQSWPLLQRVAISVGVDPETLQQEVFYSPIIIRDSDLPVEDQFTLLEYFEELQKSGGTKPEAKFLKQRTKPKKGAKIELDAMVMFVNMVSRFNTFQHMAPVAYTANKMLTDGEFAGALNDTTHGMGTNLMRDWIRRSVRGHADRITSTFWRMLNSLRDSGMAYALVANIPTVIRQTVSAFNAAAYSPAVIPHMVELTARMTVPGQFRQMHDYAAERSGIIRNRNMEAFVKKQLKSVKDLKRRYGKSVSISDTMLGAIRAMDMATVTLGWTSIYKTELSRGATESEAVTRADEWIAKTQPMADAVYLPDIMGGRYSNWYRLFFPFTNQVNNNLNLWLRDAPQPMRDQGLRGVPLTLYRYTTSMVIPALIFGMLRRGRMPEDEKELAIDLLTYPIAPIMVIGDWAVAMLEGRGQRTALHEMGFQSGTNLVRAIAKKPKTEKEAEERRRNITKNAARTLGILGGAVAPGMRGIVTSQAIRSIEAAYDLAYSEDKPPVKSLVIGQYATDTYGKKDEDDRRIVK